MGKLINATLLLTLAVASMGVAAQAAINSYTPYPYDRDVFTIRGIYDRSFEKGDILQMRFPDWAADDATVGWTGQGDLLATWTVPHGDHAQGASLWYGSRGLDLRDPLSAFNKKAARSVLVLEQGGHYFDKGARVDPANELVPEPGTLALFGLGLATGAAALRRKRAARR